MSSNARYHDDEAGKVLLGLIDIFYNVIIGRGGATCVRGRSLHLVAELLLTIITVN